MRRTVACHGGEHVRGCRPARPLCAVMRKTQAAKYAPCFCDRVQFPHRASYCARGGADRYGFGFGPPADAEQAAFDELSAFFDALAVEIQRKAG